MGRKTLPLLMALAVSLVAVGGVAAADGPVDATHPTPHETPDEGESSVGVCVVGPDSPCNGESTDGSNTTPVTHPTPLNDSDRLGSDDGDDDSDNQLWIPEDQNRDGEIDDRFVGELPTGFGDLIRSVVTPF